MGMAGEPAELPTGAAGDPAGCARAVEGATTASVEAGKAGVDMWACVGAGAKNEVDV